ncbi:MAG: hypothetical protein KA369_05620 [Spirochaetes bacterium]|nr:hypothetical protein [Spirochaetota bacterium]
MGKVKLTKKMYKCAALLKPGTTNTLILKSQWGCNFWTAQSRLKRLKSLKVIETEIAHDPVTGRFSGIDIIRINPFTERGADTEDD